MQRATALILRTSNPPHLRMTSQVMVATNGSIENVHGSKQQSLCPEGRRGITKRQGEHPLPLITFQPATPFSVQQRIGRGVIASQHRFLLPHPVHGSITPRLVQDLKQRGQMNQISTADSSNGTFDAVSLPVPHEPLPPAFRQQRRQSFMYFAGPAIFRFLVGIPCKGRNVLRIHVQSRVF